MQLLYLVIIDWKTCRLSKTGVVKLPRCHFPTRHLPRCYLLRRHLLSCEDALQDGCRLVASCKDAVCETCCWLPVAVWVCLGGELNIQIFFMVILILPASINMPFSHHRWVRYLAHRLIHRSNLVYSEARLK